MLGIRRKGGDLFEADGQRLVLHVGCGPAERVRLHRRFHGGEWRELRLDINPSCQPDIVADIVEMPEVPSESVDAVWSSHNIEHVSAHEVLEVLDEFFRVLRPGGSALITTPDLQCAAEQIVTGDLEGTIYEAPAGPITPLDMVYGHVDEIAHGNSFMAHRTGFTAMTLTARMRAAGFTDVEVRREAADMALWAEARRPAE